MVSQPAIPAVAYLRRSTNRQEFKAPLGGVATDAAVGIPAEDAVAVLLRLYLDLPALIFQGTLLAVRATAQIRDGGNGGLANHLHLGLR